MGGSHSHELVEGGQGARGVHRAPAGLKFGVMLAVVVGVSLLPRGWGEWLVLPAIFLAGVAVASGVKWWGKGGLLRRMLWLEPFVLGVAMMALFAPVGTSAGWGGRWGVFGFLVARCTLALLAMVLFSETTGFSEMLRVFRKLRVPGLLVTTLALMHRYLFVLVEESGRMRRARESRTFGEARGVRWRGMSTVIGQLFLRASERADRIYDAMRARGWGEDVTR